MGRLDGPVPGTTLGEGSPLLTAGGRTRQLGPSEADEQKALVVLLLGEFWRKGGERTLGLGMTAKYPELMLLYAVNPNKGGQRSVAARGMAKAMGLLPGFPDLGLPVARGPFHGLFLELKRSGGAKPGAGQRAMLAALVEQGYAALSVRGVGEAAQVVLGYLALSPDTFGPGAHARSVRLAMLTPKEP